MQYKGLFAEVEYLRTSGSIGEKEYMWFRFPGTEVNVRAGYKHFVWDKAVHYMRLHFNWRDRELSESVLEKVSVGGVTTVINHGSNVISREGSWTLRPEYEYVSARNFEVLASAQIGGQNKVVSQMYPHVAAQSLIIYGADARAKIYLGMFTLTAEAGYSAGSVTEDAWLVSDVSGVQTSPYRLQDWYDVHIEYVTAHRLCTGLALRCTFEEGIYLEASGTWTHGFNLKHLTAPNRYGAAIKIGYNF
jgi:hypothetical protein